MMQVDMQKPRLRPCVPIKEAVASWRQKHEQVFFLKKWLSMWEDNLLKKIVMFSKRCHHFVFILSQIARWATSGCNDAKFGDFYY